MKGLYLVVGSLDPTRRGSERDEPLEAALNAFAITLEGRPFPTDN